MGVAREETDVTNATSVPPGGGFKDRRRGLVLFGAVSIVIGALCAALALMGPLALLLIDLAPVSEVRAADPRGILLSVFLYLALAVLFVWLGIGSMKARRWVRPIMLVVAWTWLICGVLAVGFWIVFLPDFQASLAAAGSGAEDLPRGSVALAAAIVSAFLIGGYLVLPALFVAFYQSRHVRATLELRDPVERWTDRCPAPVLGLSLGLGYSALTCLMALVYGVVPVFGAILTGVPAAAVILATSGALAVLARATYRRSMAAWWGAVALTILMTASGIVTIAQVGLLEVYRRIGFQDEQIRMLESYEVLSDTSMIVSTVVLALAGLAYLIWVRKYFLTPPPRG